MRLDGRVAEPVARVYRVCGIERIAWECEIISTKTERIPHTNRTLAHSQSVRIANYDG